MMLKASSVIKGPKGRVWYRIRPQESIFNVGCSAPKIKIWLGKVYILVNAIAYYGKDSDDILREEITSLMEEWDDVRYMIRKGYAFIYCYTSEYDSIAHIVEKFNKVNI